MLKNCLDSVKSEVEWKVMCETGKTEFIIRSSSELKETITHAME